MKKRAAIYARVSTVEQVTKGFSLDAQVEQLKRLADTKQYEVAGVFTDGGYSGSLAIDKRPELTHLFDLVRDDKLDVVLVWKFDRMFRSTRKMLEAVDEMISHKVTFISLNENIDTTTPHGRFALQVVSGVAELELNVTRERSQLGRLYSIERSNWFGSLPYGYRRVDKKLVIDDKQAEVVRQIFSWFIKERVTMGEIARRLNKSNLPSPRRSEAHWYKTVVRQILIKDTYTGIHIYRLGEKEYEVKTPAIVDMAAYNEAQKRVKWNAKHMRNHCKPKHQYLFDRIVTCGECGYGWRVHTTYDRRTTGTVREYKYYNCTARDGRLVKGSCSQAGLTEGALDRAVWGELKSVLLNPNRYYESVFKKLKEMTDGDKRVTALRKAQGELKKLNESMGRLNEVYMLGNMEKEHYLIETNELRKQISEAEEMAARLEPVLGDIPTEETIRQNTSRIVAELPGRLENLSYDQRRTIIKNLVSKLVIQDGLVEVSVSLFPEDKKGNIGSAEKIYHMPGGSFYDRTNAEECFETEDAAKTAGYRKSSR